MATQTSLDPSALRTQLVQQKPVFEKKILSIASTTSQLVKMSSPQGLRQVLRTEFPDYELVTKAYENGQRALVDLQAFLQRNPSDSSTKKTEEAQLQGHLTILGSIRDQMKQVLGNTAFRLEVVEGRVKNGNLESCDDYFKSAFETYRREQSLAAEVIVQPGMARALEKALNPEKAPPVATAPETPEAATSPSLASTASSPEEPDDVFFPALHPALQIPSPASTPPFTPQSPSLHSLSNELPPLPPGHFRRPDPVEESPTPCTAALKKFWKSLFGQDKPIVLQPPVSRKPLPKPGTAKPGTVKFAKPRGDSPMPLVSLDPKNQIGLRQRRSIPEEKNGL